MYTTRHVGKYKITFKLVINQWTNEILQHIVVSSGQYLGLRFFDTFTNTFFSSRIFPTIKHLFMKIAQKTKNDKFQENLFRPGIIVDVARYRAAAQRLRNTGLDVTMRREILTAVIIYMKSDAVLMILEFYVYPYRSVLVLRWFKLLSVSNMTGKKLHL